VALFELKIGKAAGVVGLVGMVKIKNGGKHTLKLP
jgi:hypothetical protein